MSATATLAELIAGSFRELSEGSIVKGKILEIKPQVILVDIGYKSEGAIPSNEFEDEDIQVGDEVEVLLERLENDEGMVVLSKEKAAHRQNWEKIYNVFKDGGLVKGKIKSVVKGGLMVNVGVEAFLPGSQIDIIPPKDLNEYVGKVFEFKIVKINDERKNIVLSRREVIEAERAEQRQKFLDGVTPGDKVIGIVKNITDFGAFVDLNGMDGLLHITDMSWGRLNHPSEMLGIGQKIEVQILEVNREKERVSLGLKQLQNNPWENIEARYPVGQRVRGKVTKLVAYGAFVEVEEGVEGLVHVSELSWTKRIARPSDVLTVGQEIEASVLGINKEERKISLGVRQLDTNPWDDIDARYPIGTQMKRAVRNLTAYGAFVELEEGIDGMIHVSDLSWTRKINHPSELLKKGQEVDAVVLGIDKANQRISLGMKQLDTDPWSIIDTRFKVGDVVKGRVAKIASFGAFVELEDDIDGLVHISQISEDRIEKVKDKLNVGDEVEARVIKVDKVERRIGLSIKAMNYSEADIQKESQAFEALRPSTDLVGLEQAFKFATEEWRPGGQ
ncbi:MAG: 30S ribosomal protein S1 [Verrucomicrobia bacterium 12-59-8]|jgi:small subunit ribosomal protein S1|uniref:30S ribosomal protein S1 n=1 Tax=Prosthecobacter sp. TaxID=1965333 RepID=UPI000BC80BDA|nr:30S ribosomal protein S1 [Prosthecobacter sp.]MCF7787974.1 30S ribosomal protein S1 [Prosthecobacter sp.]OYW77425.1 MAG: 30S ribosomal protein S1 [Verrucomicrobia bacterium 12-59-8]OYX02465.1 MAG: 30S ribosomal protein S1 [Bosea sp. 32-68-6]